MRRERISSTSLGSIHVFGFGITQVKPHNFSFSIGRYTLGEMLAIFEDRILVFVGDLFIDIFLLWNDTASACF